MSSYFILGSWLLVAEGYICQKAKRKKLSVTLKGAAFFQPPMPVLLISHAVVQPDEYDVALETTTIRQGVIV